MVDYGTNIMDKIDKYIMECYVKEQINNHEEQFSIYGIIGAFFIIVDTILLIVLCFKVFI